MSNLYDLMKKELEEINREWDRRRSAWGRGVGLYAYDLLEDVSEYKDQRDPENTQELKKFALCGAESWRQKSYGGSSLVYNADIAERLLTPSEFKRWENNSLDLDLLDLQARALEQAYNRLAKAYRRATQALKEEQSRAAA